MEAVSIVLKFVSIEATLDTVKGPYRSTITSGKVILVGISDTYAVS